MKFQTRDKMNMCIQGGQRIGLFILNPIFYGLIIICVSLLCSQISFAGPKDSKTPNKTSTQNNSKASANIAQYQKYVNSLAPDLLGNVKLAKEKFYEMFMKKSEDMIEINSQCDTYDIYEPKTSVKKCRNENECKAVSECEKTRDAVKETEQAFRIFRNFYKEEIRIHNRKIDLTGNYFDLWYGLYDNYDLKNGIKYECDFSRITKVARSDEIDKFISAYPEEYQLLTDLNEAGFRIEDDSEGGLIITESYVYLLRDAFDNSHFNKYPLNYYFVFLRDEFKEKIQGDAGIFISWEELKNRIERWDKFSQSNKYLPETSHEIKAHISSYLYMLLFGLDNTPIINSYENSNSECALSPEVRLVYSDYLKDNKKSIYYPLINDIYNFWKKHNFNCVDNLYSEIYKIYDKYIKNEDDDLPTDANCCF